MVTSSVFFLVALGFASAALLAVAAIFLKVEEDPMLAKIEEALRITSYNVCYTKLLRTFRW